MKRLTQVMTLLLMMLILLAIGAQGQSNKAQLKTKELGAQAANSSVSGSGTPGQLAKWSGVAGSNTYVLGNSNIFEDKFGKVGIGTITPTSPLTVAGMIETTLGGYKFPDGTVQTTAATAGLQAVFHD